MRMMHNIALHRLGLLCKYFLLVAGLGRVVVFRPVLSCIVDIMTSTEGNDYAFKDSGNLEMRRTQSAARITIKILLTVAIVK
jgi:hypothetical protein